MHTYIITRGIKHDVDNFITQLQGKYLPMKHNMWQKGQPKQDLVVQVAVRPIQLWEIVYPEEHKDVMLNTLLQGGSGATQHSKHSKFVWAARKALGCKPIPKYSTKDKIPIELKNVEVVGIGIKEDYYTDDVTGERYYNATPEQKAKSSEGL